jgi:8-oxo-dGTP pyrophosphatase MutT (NUDIX family)
MQKFPLTRVNDFLIPYFELANFLTKPLSIDNLRVKIRKTEFEIPDKKIQQFKERMVKKVEAQMKKIGKIFYDGPLVRLIDFLWLENKQKLCIEVEKTTFFTYFFTNRSLENPIVWKMVTAQGNSIKNLNDGLANPIGCNLLLITSDNFVIIVRRPHSSILYPGFYGLIPAGFAHPEKDNCNPFKTIRREAYEELGIKIKEPRLISIGRSDDRHIEFCFFTKTKYSKQEILLPQRLKILKKTPELWKSKVEDGMRILSVEFSKEKLMPYFSTITTIPSGVVNKGKIWKIGKTPAWVPAYAFMVLKLLRLDKTLIRAVADK